MLSLGLWGRGEEHSGQERGFIHTQLTEKAASHGSSAHRVLLVRAPPVCEMAQHSGGLHLLRQRENVRKEGGSAAAQAHKVPKPRKREARREARSCHGRPILLGERGLDLMQQWLDVVTHRARGGGALSSVFEEGVANAIASQRRLTGRGSGEEREREIG